MKISTRTLYGTRAVCELARGGLSLKEISKRQNIPLKYLAKIMSSLKAAGIVKALRGAAGGFVLARTPGEIALWDIFNYFEGSIAPKKCDSAWKGLENNMREYLQKIKISDLIKNNIELKKPALF